MLSDIFDTAPRLVQSISSVASSADETSAKAACVAFLQSVPLLSDLEEFCAQAKFGVATSCRTVLEDDRGRLLQFFLEGGMRLDQTAYSFDVSFQWTARTRPFEQYLVGSVEIATCILTDASFRDTHLIPALIRDALILSIAQGCIFHLIVSVPPPNDKLTKLFGGKQIPVAQRVTVLSRKRAGDESSRQSDIERTVLAAEVKYCRDCGEWIPFEVVRAQCAGHSYGEGVYSDCKTCNSMSPHAL